MGRRPLLLGERRSQRSGHKNAQSLLTRLKASSSEEEAIKRGGRKGFYVRPSKAVEMGGGFYVPGLEGSKFRVGFAILALALLGVNRAILPGYAPLQNQVTSEVLTVVAAVALLFHAISENIAATKVAGEMSLASSAAATASGGAQTVAVPSSVLLNDRLPESRTDDELWLMASALQVFPASSTILSLEETGVVSAYAPSLCADDAAQRAFAACVKSISGRAAIEFERSEPGAEIQDIFNIVPEKCNRVLVCGGGARVLVIGVPSEWKDFSENQVLWLSQLAMLPSA